jgi:hypothetical protein
MIGQPIERTSMSAADDRTHDAGGDRVDEVTKYEEEVEARASHTPDRPPTPDEEAAAGENELDPRVAEHEREMGRIGAETTGEGEIR